MTTSILTQTDKSLPKLKSFQRWISLWCYWPLITWHDNPSNNNQTHARNFGHVWTHMYTQTLMYLYRHINANQLEGLQTFLVCENAMILLLVQLGIFSCLFHIYLYRLIWNKLEWGTQRNRGTFFSFNVQAERICREYLWITHRWEVNDTVSPEALKFIIIQN